MSNTLTTIRLNGELGKKFGRVHKLAVHSAAEAVKALSVILPGFKAHLLASRSDGLGYAVFVGKENISKDQLRNPAAGKTIKIAPVIQGSKNGGVLQIIVGAVLVIAGFFDGGTTYAAGAAMILGGVVSLLSPLNHTTLAAQQTQQRKETLYRFYTEDSP